MFDAMTSNKVYKEKQCTLYALEEIKIDGDFVDLSAQRELKITDIL